MTPKVSIIMGSTSDLKIMEEAAKFFDEMEIPYEINALSAHRVPELVMDFAKNAHKRGIKVVIAGAGGAGGPWFPGGLHRRRGGGLQAHEGTWLKNGSNKNRGAGNLRCRDFLCTFIRYEPPASTGALQSR